MSCDGYLSAEEAYELLHAALMRSGSHHAARELKFWHDEANYWMGQYSNVVGEY